MKNLKCSHIKNLQLWGWESYMKTRNSLVLQLLFLNFTELFQPSCLHILFAQLKRYLKFWKKTCITELNSIPTILRNSAPNSQYNSITFAEKCTDSEVAVNIDFFMISLAYTEKSHCRDGDITAHFLLPGFRISHRFEILQVNILAGQ